MPIPAVYLPQRGLPPDTRSMWGFEPVVTRDSDKPIPYVNRDGLTLVADIRSPDGMDLLAVPEAVFTGTGKPAYVAEPQLLAVGHFTDAHPPEWKEAAYTAQALLVAIGPDDAPVLRQAYPGESPVRAIRRLWIFNAAIAAVHLVAPGRRWRRH